MERCCQQLLILSQVHPHAVVFCFPLLMLSLFFFIFTLPPQYLLYLHLCFTPSLSCCLSVMWSRTDAGSPNCGTAISALLWLLGSPSETGFGDAPPSPSASKKREREKERERESGRAGHQAISQNSNDPSKMSLFSEWAASHLQCSRAHCEPGGFRGVRICN